MRWLGLLLMTTVGAAWAINPGAEIERVDRSRVGAVTDQVVFEGEPQVVAQVMGAVVGPGATPSGELRAVDPQAGGERRVVVSATRVDEADEGSPRSEFLAAVERLEEDLVRQGGYPAVPSQEIRLKDSGYRTDGERFRLEAGRHAYDSRTGFAEVAAEEKKDPAFRVSGFLQGVKEGWGPWEREYQVFSPTGSNRNAELSWLAEMEPTPSWSCRMYFPVDWKTTGYAFRRADGKSAYKSGELLYDGVTGTFQLKLHREAPAESRSLSPERLEQELGPAFGGCEVVGEAGLLQDLGLLKRAVDKEPVVHLSNPATMELSGTNALDGLALAAFSRHIRTLPAARFQGAEEGRASVAGRLSLVDKLGQLHQVRIRAGRATEYDWVIGQLCYLEQEVAVAESSAFDEAEERQNRSTIFAGK